MKLSNFIDDAEDETVILASDNMNLRVQDLSTERDRFSSFLTVIHGKNVTLDFKSNFVLAMWLILLDGRASRLTLLPPELDNENKSKFIQLTNSKFILSDRDIHSVALEPYSVNLTFYDVTQLQTEEIASSQSLSDFETQWILLTSGTTGSPKLVRHTLKSLTNTSKRSKKMTKRTWGLLYGLQRIAGLQVFLQSLLSCNKLVIAEIEQSLAEKIQLFSRHAVDCLSATPTLWRQMLMFTEFPKFTFTTITLGGEIVDGNILRALKKTFPQAKIRHIYASTEAGVGFSVADGLPGFPESYLHNPISDVSLKLTETNTLLIRSNSRSSGYLGSATLDVVEGYIDTGDLIRIKEDRCYFEGRENGTINVGGNKVHPEHIEQVLLEFPGVRFAHVTAKKSPIIGSLVQANIVIDDSIINQKEFIAKLREHCNGQLERFMVPAFFKIEDEIKLNASGKICRNE